MLRARDLPGRLPDGALALGLAGLLALPSCAGAGDGQAAPAPSAAHASASASSPAERACARIVSAVGWADFMLVSPGHERNQDFRSGVRGRLAYVEGAVVQSGDDLPPRAVGPAQELRIQARRVVDTDASRAAQVAGLRAYHRAVRDLNDACDARTSDR